MEKGQGAEGLLFLLFFVLKLSAHKVLCLSHNGSCKQLGSDTHSARSPFFSSSAGLSGTRLSPAAALHAGRTIQAPLPGSGELAAGISHPGPSRQAGRQAGIALTLPSLIPLLPWEIPQLCHFFCFLFVTITQTLNVYGRRGGAAL